MTNAEKYKTAAERSKAHMDWCKKNYKRKARNCGDIECTECTFRWLNLEAEEEKPLPCPFCGGKCTVDGACTNEHHDDGTWFISCNNENCYYSSGLTHGKDAAIAGHNRVARAVMEAGKKEVQ